MEDLEEMNAQIDTAHFRALLEEEKEKVLQERLRLRKGLTGEDRSTWFEQEGGDDVVSADAATALIEKEQDLFHSAELDQRLKEIDHALERMENGSYGVCELCQQPIPPARLEALPWTSLCVSCREVVE